MSSRAQWLCEALLKAANLFIGVWRSGLSAGSCREGRGAPSRNPEKVNKAELRGSVASSCYFRKGDMIPHPCPPELYVCGQRRKGCWGQNGQEAFELDQRAPLVSSRDQTVPCLPHPLHRAF